MGTPALGYCYFFSLAFPGGSVVKKQLPTQETRRPVPSPGGEDPLEEEMTTTPIFAWTNPMDKGASRATVHGVAESDTT